MSIGMRRTASTAQSATAIKAMTTVIGLLRAARTRRILFFPSRNSLAHLGKEWLNIARRDGNSEQPPPDAQTGQSIVYLGLGE
jgi:hypothetical protein